jgi:hypothetical protein
MKTRRIFLGIKADGTRETFRAADVPTFETHGERYRYAVGPFRTARGARFMRDHGAGNPHCRCVADAERLARLG